MQKDNRDSMFKNRYNDVEKFLKSEIFCSENFYVDEIVDENDIKKMGDGELIYFQYYCGMGYDDVYNEIAIIGAVEGFDVEISYLRKYIYDFETHKDIGPGFLEIKSFKGLEDYDNKKSFDYYYHNRFDEIDGVVNEYKLKNFEVVGLEFGNFLLVNKKYFNNYDIFIKELSKKYGLREKFFWLNLKIVSKIFHSGHKEEFLQC